MNGSASKWPLEAITDDALKTANSRDCSKTSVPILGKAVELCSQLGISELCKVTAQIDPETHGLTADSFSQVQRIMGRTQRRQRVTIHVNEGRNAGAPQSGPLLSRATYHIDVTRAGGS
jgi:hypothetical protein